MNTFRAEYGAKPASVDDLYYLDIVKMAVMDRFLGASDGRAMEEAREQAEILAAALRAATTPDGDFLMAHAQHLLSCCREIAEARLN